MGFGRRKRLGVTAAGFSGDGERAPSLIGRGGEIRHFRRPPGLAKPSRLRERPQLGPEPCRH